MHVGERSDSFLTPHAEYLALGPDPASRAKAYRALFAQVLPVDLVDEIRRYLAQERALGSGRFAPWSNPARAGFPRSGRPDGHPERECP